MQIHNYPVDMETLGQVSDLGNFDSDQSADLSQFSPPNTRFQHKVLTVVC
jgi:hypothetical protein